MKQLLLTLLGVAALCGLSPHPAAAQTTPEVKTATFEITEDAFTQGKISVGHRIKGAHKDAPDPTDFTLDLNDQPTTLHEPLTGVKGFGWGLIYIKAVDTDDATARIDFDYSKSPVIKDVVPYRGTSKLQTGSLELYKTDDEPSTAFSISLGEDKRIKSVEFIPTAGTTGGFYAQRTSIVTKYIKAVENIQSLDASKIYSLTDSAKTNNSYYTTFTFSADGPYGSEQPLCLRTMWATSAYEMKLAKIKVTYIDVTDEIPSENITYSYGKKYGDAIYYMQDNETEWTAAGLSTVKLDGQTVKVKIGESITEFTRPESPKTGQPTVIINGGDYWVGTTIKCTFRTYLDPALIADGANEAYRVTYSISGKFNTASSRAARIRSNLTPPATGVKSTENTTEELLTINNLTGLSSNDKVTVNDKPTYDYAAYSFTANATQAQKNGTDAAVIFDHIRLTYTSSKSHEAQGPMAPDVKISSGATLDATAGKYRLFGSAKATIGSFDGCTDTGVKYYYMLSDAPVDAASFTTAAATEANEVTIDGSKACLAVRAYATVDGKEVGSAVRNFEFVKTDIINLESAAEITADLKGKTVRLGFPLNIIADGTLGSDKLTYMIYARDPENNPVVMKSRLASTTDATTPGAAFQITKNATPKGVIFAPAAGVIATVDTDKAGHPILVLKDADNSIDHFAECYTGAALAFDATEIKAAGIDLNYALTLNTHNLVEEISESHYGRMVYMRGVTYNTADKRFEKDGKTIPVATDPTNLDKYIQAPSSFYQKFTTLPTDATIHYTICGIVEYDPNAEAGSQYYIMLRNCVETQNLTGITFPTAGQVKGPLTENDDKTAGSIDIIHSATTIAAHPTGATSGGYIYTYTDHSKGTATTSFISYSSNISITNNIIFFKDGKCEIKIARTSLSSTTNDIEYDRGDTYTLTLNDEAKGMPVYSAFSQIDPANDKGFVRIKTPYSIPYHVGNASGNWDWPIAMTAYLKGNYILVRDVATNDDGQPAAHQDQNPDFYLVYSAKGWDTKVVRNHYRTSSSTGRRAIREGDGVAILTFHIGDDDMVLDASNMAKPASSNTNSTNDWHFTSPVGSSESAYKDHLDDWRVSSTISDPKQTLIDESYLRKVIAINGAKIKKTADDNATISLKNDVALSWDCLGAADKDTHQAVIANAGDDATYNVTAYVMKDGNGGFKLEVISLECLTGIISVCEHEHHDTYYGKASLDRFADGDIVTLRGVKVTKTFAEGSTTDYTLSTTIGNEEIDFVWETNPSLQYTHKSTINKDMGTNTVTPSTFNISGNLKIDGDKKSIDLATVGKQSQSKLTVYSNGATIPTSKRVSFQSYARITFDAPKGTEIAYKILSVEGEPVDDGKWLPITTSDTLTIDRTHVIQIAGCAAGSNAQTSANISFTKTAKEAKSIDDMLAADNTTNYLHLRNTVRVSSAFTAWPFGNILTVTDGAGHHLLLHVDNYSPLPETGSLLKDFAVQRVTSDHTLTIGSLNNSYQYQFIGNTADYTATPEEGDDLPSIEPLITDSPEAADVEKLIRITDAFITGENASNLTVKTAGGNTIALRNAFECEIADNGPESGYILTGLLLPRKGKSVPRSEAAVVADEATPLTLDDMEFLPINIEKRRAAATPRLEVTGHESMEDNTVVTIEDVTVSMTSDEAYSTIEYSTDGGTTWTVYDGKPLTIGSSTEIQARTIVKGFDPSAIAKLDIRREYYSDAAKVVTEQKGGYTLVTLLPVNDLPQGTGYTIHYTLDGSEPDIKSDVYSAPLELTEAATVKALMIEHGKRPAKTVASQALTVRANDLDITADKGEGFTTVAIAPKNAKHVDPKAEIRYTTDGTEPTASSQLYKGEFEVEAADNGMTIKAICIEPGKTAGNVASATVAVEGLRPSCDVTISYTEADGVYTITLTAPAGKIFYALNDATEFKLYDPAKPITYVSDTDGTCRIRAYALEEGKKEGKIAEHSFAVTGISGVEADQEAGSVRVEGNSIIVPEGAQTFDIAGRRVNPQGLPRGIYIVRLASGKAVKAVVK